jgi:uncharacterized protein (DUF1697 family)
MARQVALLRGVNVGRNRRVPMAALREALDGYGDVVTHGQSGNVVLETRKSGRALERELEGVLAERLGLETRVIVRSRAQLEKVVDHNPLSTFAKNGSRFLVTFLADKPSAAKAKALGDDFGSEQAVLHGQEVYSWHPDGLQRSKLAALIADGLGTVGTARNWNTVTKLLALAYEPG